MPLTKRLLCLTVATAFAAQIPRPAPDFSIDTSSGKPIRLSQYKGKVCAVAFILTTCSHCQKTVGILSKLQTEYGPRGFQVVASAVEDLSPLHVPDFVKTYQPTFPVGFNDRNAALQFLARSHTEPLYMPQLVFLDRQGTIRAQYGGEQPFFAAGQEEQNLRNQIESLVKEK